MSRYDGALHSGIRIVVWWCFGSVSASCGNERWGVGGGRRM